MEIINFQCGQCGNMMGVTIDCLGQQVRCPTCEQVVVAPAAAPELSPREPASVGSHDHEDIFTPPDSDGLFGSEPAPRLEMPPASPSSNGPPVHQTPYLDPEPPPAPAPAVASPPVVVGTPADGGYRAESFSDTSAAGARADAGYPDEPGELPTAPPSSRRKPQRSSIVPILVIFSLFSYAILVTVVAVILYLRVMADKAPPSPLDQLPDIDGDAHGVKKSNVTWDIRDEFKLAMPDRLKVGLGEKLQVGDLEIEPYRVERRRVDVLDEGSKGKKEQMDFDSVVLHLRLRNTSSNSSFVPLDPYFDRGMRHPGAVPARPAEADGPDALARYEEGSNGYWEKWTDKKVGYPQGGPPLTLLEVGERRYFGSSSDWYERNRDPGLRLRRAWVEGRSDLPQYLDPGKTLDTFVSTDGRDSRLQEQLKTYHGPLLYRVHLRRGLVTRSDGKQVSATAVIGVRFTTDDI
jgi:hypothetical protein